MNTVASTRDLRRARRAFLLVGLAVSVLILCATTVWVFVLGDGSAWILALVTLLLIALIAMTLVFRTGEALQVTRSSGRVFVV
ncbi:MAG: hypothetical protein V4703_00305, partial [Actinomycetota bacterium]